jgi:hypothetical protein
MHASRRRSQNTTTIILFVNGNNCQQWRPTNRNPCPPSPEIPPQIQVCIQALARPHHQPCLQLISTRRRSYLNSAGALLFQANSTLEFHLLLNLDSNNYDSAPGDVFEKNKPFLKTKMIESCNGLFLCCDDSNPPERLRRYYGNYKHTYSSRFCVWNPTSKRYALLPPLLSLPCSLRGILRLEGISLAFDPSKSLEYKVVAVCQYTLLENCYQIQIYSSKDGTWRVSVRYFNPPPVDFLRGVFCKGTIHWNRTVIKIWLWPFS